MKRLHPSTLGELPAAVTTPAYDRDNLEAGIVHLGLGAFHRAHQALYTERAIANSDGDWGIIGVCMRSVTVSKQLSPQDGLYSVLVEDATGAELCVVGCIQQVLVAPRDLAAVASAIARHTVKIVTLTVTEKGYHLAPDGRSLNVSDDAVSCDLESPESPSTTVGILALGLRERLRTGGAPLTLISCDNLSHNSGVLRVVLEQYLAQTFPEVIPWLESSATFPCSMVDRIVPAVTESVRQRLAGDLGVRDEAAVVTEPFSQWIVEDNFAAGRPDWASAGVQFVSEVAPFETIKLRLLNASHSAIAYCGLLAGLETVDAVMAHARPRRFIEQLMDRDLMPLLEVPAGFDLSAYRDQLLRRFANPCLQHRCAQIAMDGSEKIAQRWFPALREAPVPLLRVALSAWLYFVLCSRYPIEDPHVQRLQALRESSAPMRERLISTLACARISADEVGEFEQLLSELEKNMNTMADIGLQGLLEA